MNIKNIRIVVNIDLVDGTYIQKTLDLNEAIKRKGVCNEKMKKIVVLIVLIVLAIGISSWMLTFYKKSQECQKWCNINTGLVNCGIINSTCKGYDTFHKTWYSRDLR